MLQGRYCLADPIFQFRIAAIGITLEQEHGVLVSAYRLRSELQSELVASYPSASMFTTDFAKAVRFLSVVFSSASVASKSRAASSKPNSSAQVRSGEANERKASAYFAMAQLDRRSRSHNRAHWRSSRSARGRADLRGLSDRHLIEPLALASSAPPIFIADKIPALELNLFQPVTNTLKLVEEFR